MAPTPELPVLGSAGSPKRTWHPCEAATWRRSRHQRPRGQALKVWGEDLPGHQQSLGHHWMEGFQPPTLEAGTGTQDGAKQWGPWGRKGESDTG